MTTVAHATVLGDLPDISSLLQDHLELHLGSLPRWALFCQYRALVIPNQGIRYSRSANCLAEVFIPAHYELDNNEFLGFVFCVFLDLNVISLRLRIPTTDLRH